MKMTCFKTFQLIFAILAIAMESIIPAQAANEPLEAQIRVDKTADGRVLLTSTVPSDECLASAQAYINLLLPHAEALADAPIDVTSPDNVLTGTGRIGLPEDLLAAWRGGKPGHGSIVIFTDFCRQSAANQRVTIAHELGHAIDQMAFTGQRAWDSHDAMHPWGERRGEVAASAWALSIYQRAGLPASELESHFSHWQNGYWGAVQAYSTSHSK